MNSRLYSSFILLFLALAIVSAAEDINFKDSSNQILEKQISGDFGDFTQKLFKYSSTLELNSVIILYVLFLMILLTLLNITPLLPFFQVKMARFAAAVIISILIAISGGLSAMTEYLSSLAQDLTATWGNVVALFFIVIIACILIVVSSLLNKIKKSEDIEQAEIIGMKLGVGSGMARKKLE